MCPTGTSAHSTTTTRPSNLRSAFDVLDVDNDGKISRDDLQTFYGEFLGVGKSEDDVIDTMITVADSNKDGYVEYDEFEKVLEGNKNGSNNNKRRNGRLSVMEDVFMVMDKDGDGKVGKEDLKSYLNMAGLEASDDDVKAMLKLGGGDQNGGGVTYEGLLKILSI